MITFSVAVLQCYLIVSRLKVMKDLLRTLFIYKNIVIYCTMDQRKIVMVIFPSPPQK